MSSDTRPRESGQLKVPEEIPDGVYEADGGRVILLVINGRGAFNTAEHFDLTAALNSYPDLSYRGDMEGNWEVREVPPHKIRKVVRFAGERADDKGMRFPLRTPADAQAESLQRIDALLGRIRQGK